MENNAPLCSLVPLLVLHILSLDLWQWKVRARTWLDSGFLFCSPGPWWTGLPIVKELAMSTSTPAKRQRTPSAWQPCGGNQQTITGMLTQLLSVTGLVLGALLVAPVSVNPCSKWLHVVLAYSVQTH
ncbi:hypothetical protein AOLI_G00141150 [Acnodon oligacanthus]